MREPHIVVAALVLTAPLLVPLAHVFFGTWSQFADEVGLRGDGAPDTLRDAWSRFTMHPTDVLFEVARDLLGLFVAYAIILATAYHVLAFAVAFFEH